MNIVQKPSKNFYPNRQGWIPDIIVDHITGGIRDSSMINEFQGNDRASSTFGIGIDGTKYQFTDIRVGAWGNGSSPSKTYKENGVWKESKVWNGYSLLESVRTRNANANLFTISIEHVNAGGGVLNAAQLKSTIELHRYIIDEVKRIYGFTIPIDRNHITGHCFIAPKTKPCCPGANFPYDKILAGLKGTGTIKSDTTSNMTMKVGAKYQLKLTAAFQPDCIAGSSGVVKIAYVRNSGSDYFYSITAVKSGVTGIYTNNGQKLFIVTVK